jgi:hypothetical protein
MSGIAEVIWAYPTRTLASGTPGTPNGYAELVADAVWEYVIRAMSYDGVVATLGTTAYWKLEGDATDSSGNGNHLTNNGATFGADGPWTDATAAQLDGINDYLNAVLSIPGDFTVNAWAYLDSAGDFPMVVTFGSYTTPDLRFNSTTRTPEFVPASSSDAVATGTWVMLTGIRNGTNHSLYVNAVHATTAPQAAYMDAPAVVDVGRRFDAPHYYFPGRLARIAIHPEALSEFEIEFLYANQFEEVAAETGVSGEATIAIDDITASGTGVSVVTATATITLDAITASSTGVSTVVGTATIALDAITAAATATSIIAASATILLDDITVSATSTVLVTGSATITLDAITTLSTAVSVIGATATILLDDITVSASNAALVTWIIRFVTPTLTGPLVSSPSLTGPLLTSSMLVGPLVSSPSIE